MTPPRRIACILARRAHASQKHEGIAAFAQACGRFTPKLALRQEGPDAGVVFLDIGASLRLFSEAAIRARAQVLARRLGWTTRIAFAKTAAIALARARSPRFDDSGDFAELPLSLAVIEGFLCPFEASFAIDDEVRKRLLAMVTKLQTLGLASCADFLALPGATLASRFGMEAPLLCTRFRGEQDAAWPGYHPSERIEEAADLSSLAALENESLTFILRSLVDRAMLRLMGEAKRASRVLLTLELERWSTVREPSRRIELELPIAQGSVAGLLPILSHRLSHELERAPIEAPLRGVRFRVLETVPGRAAQRDFFGAKEEEAEAREAIRGRLMNELGEKNVFYAVPTQRYRPETAWARALEPEPKTKPLAYARPSRLLKTPVPIERHGEWLVHREGRRWRILRWEGPERLASDWWDLSIGEFCRDYYRAVSENETQLWIFADRSFNPPRYYLHGYFD